LEKILCEYEESRPGFMGPDEHLCKHCYASVDESDNTITH